MVSSKPYLLRALNDWILDGGRTPYLIVDVHGPGVEVPAQAVRDGRLVLNISPRATRNLVIGNEEVRFHARFSGVSRPVRIPVDAVIAIYANEDGQGMAFTPGHAGTDEQGTQDPQPEGPHLRVIK